MGMMMMADWRTDWRTKAQALAEHGPVVEKRRFENHLATEGLKDGAASGENRVTTHVELDVNMRLLIGGLARIEARLSEEQKQAAARFRALYDGAMIGGARATDYSQPMVDTSAKATNPADGGIDARRRYAEAVRELGMLGSSIVEKVVCHEMSFRDLARSLGEPGGGRASRQVQQRVLCQIDRLVDHFGLVPKPGPPRMRFAGERPWVVGASEDGPVDDSEQQA